MIRFLKDFFYKKMSSANRKHVVYIVPTLDGFKVITLNLLLLVIGLVYANNYVLLFNFMLFCLFMSSMFYTHFNLNKLKLEYAHFDSIFLEELSLLRLRFSTSGTHGHYFIKAKIKSDRFRLLDNDSFSVSSELKEVTLNLQGLTRGRMIVDTIYFETEFPFNFFRCFTFFRIDQTLSVCPARKNLGLHQELNLDESVQDDIDEFVLKNYSPGDSLKRIDWKKLAQSEKMLTRHPMNIIQAPVLLSVNTDVDLERQLQSVCFSVFHYHLQNIKYGIKLKDDVLVLPDHSSEHLSFCLEQLATYAS